MSQNEFKFKLLGMPFGTANGKLRKALLYRAIQQLGQDSCYRCGLKITTAEEFSIDHKEAWMSQLDPIEAFFSLDNIGFSHILCNVSAGARPTKKWANQQERSKEQSRLRRADPAQYAKFLQYKRSRYAEVKALNSMAQPILL